MIKGIMIEEELDKYLSHPFFERVNVPNISIDTVLSMMMVTPEGVNCNLSSDNINVFKDDMNEVPNIQKELDYLAKAYEEKAVYLKKLHLPMILICAKAAIADKIKEARFKEIIDSFFDSNNAEYKKACGNTMNSKINVNKRIEIMLDYYKKQIAK